MSWRNFLVRAFFVCGFFMLFSMPAAAQTVGSFSTTWKTDNPGTTASNQIRIPTTGAGYNYNIYWEDVSSSTINGTLLGRTGATTITFPAPGTYRVDITGTFPRIYFNNGGDRQKILSINQWGSIAWTSMANAFAGATNLQSTAADTPNLSGASSTIYMFADTAFNQDISGWNVSTITNMTGMFSGATSFNQSLSGWDVSNVTTFDYLFYGATNFNQSLEDWNVSPTATFSAIFYNTAFNQDFTTWTWLYNPARTSWAGLLEGANAFTVDISNLVIPANITNLSSFFRRNTTFNQNISNWDVSHVTQMVLMFSEATSFNQPLNSWNVANVTSMSNMFDSMSAFNQPLNNWDVSNVTDMSCMFCYTTSFNQDISDWDVSSVTSMSTMFYENPTFNQPLDGWVTSSLTDFSYMFENATAFDQDISNFDVSNVTNAYNVFRGSALSTSNYTKILEGWAAQAVQSGVDLTFIGDSGSPNHTVQPHKPHAIY